METGELHFNTPGPGRERGDVGGNRRNGCIGGRSRKGEGEGGT